MIDELRQLEAGYFDQPVMGQREDLKRINEIREQLGMPLVDNMLREPAKPKVKPKKDLSKAKELYEAYKIKAAELQKHQEYAERVIMATEGPGMTPVEPLATMGCNGGALLCDHCKKPIILEGGNFNNVPVDQAWARQSPVARINWVSWIKGGMVVELQSNNTVRIYHGYQSNDNDCCQVAYREDQRKRAEHKLDISNGLTDDLYELTKDYSLVNKIINLMFGYDPGFGVNQP